MNLNGYKMVDRFEQVDLFSADEYRRRMDCIKAIMDKKSLDTVIFVECASVAYDQWLMGKRFLEYMVIPKNEAAIGVLWQEIDETGIDNQIGEVDFSRYTMQKPCTPPWDGVRFINRVTDKKIAELIAGSTPTRIGLVSPESISAELWDSLKAKLPRAEFEDITMDVDMVKCVKSREEIAAIEASASVQRRIVEALPQILRVGKSMRDVDREVKAYLCSMGASGFLHGGVMSNGKQDEPARFTPTSDRKICYGDRFFALMEANGPGHQHVAFGRHITLGEPTKGFAEAIEKGVKLNKFAAAQLKPGATLSEVVKRTTEYAHSIGNELKVCNWMHGLGGFFYERYSLEDPSQDIPLQENALVHCHPVTYRYFPELGPKVREDYFVLNTYLITPEGGKDMSGIPLDLRTICC